MSNDLRPQGLSLLREAVGDPKAEFRGGQWEAIERIIVGRQRLLLVQRTGWGKSLVYFIATKLLRRQGHGPTLLISPLLALMRNQLLAAERAGIKAGRIDSSNREAWPEQERALLSGEVDILFVSPERLGNSDFRDTVLLPLMESVGIGLLVVDEAHCISDWGHDFRPDYRRIRRILQALPPSTPALLTTATANDRVVADISEQLGSGLVTLRGTLDRDSLRLQCHRLPNRAERLAWLGAHLASLPGSGIIYVLTVKDATLVAGWLEHLGYRAAAYWGGLESERREDLERQLLANEVKALVATTALSMGFDKPDIGFIVHYQRPPSVIHYYQQVGRAGRAIDDAYGILLSGEEDDDIADYFIETAFPDSEAVDRILQVLESVDSGLMEWELEREVNLQRATLQKALKLLAVDDPAPVVYERPLWRRTPVPYERDQARIDRLASLRRSEQEEMQRYVEGSHCHMDFLRRALDDPASEACGRCAVCRGEDIVPRQVPDALARRAVEFLKRQSIKIPPRKKWPGDALAIYDLVGMISVELRAQEGRALCWWGDPGLGALVREGKQQSRVFADELVEACAEMILRDWRPEPSPRWVTCVPSRRRPELVPSFAVRLAASLQLPFVECIHVVREAQPQKVMRNSYQQARNLAGVFEVDRSRVMDDPLLLVDDVVDSGWTMTLLSGLLQRAGSGAVFPLALARATPRGDQ